MTLLPTQYFLSFVLHLDIFHIQFITINILSLKNMSCILISFLFISKKYFSGIRPSAESTSNEFLLKTDLSPLWPLIKGRVWGHEHSEHSRNLKIQHETELVEDYRIFSVGKVGI